MNTRAVTLMTVPFLCLFLGYIGDPGGYECQNFYNGTSNHYLKKYSHNPIHTWCLHLLGECSELISLLAMLAEFWPSSGQRKLMNLDENGHFRWCVHLLVECSELTHFGATFAKSWPSENAGFWPLSEKLLSCGIMFTRSISDMVFTLVRGVFTNDSIFCAIGLI